MPISRDDMMRRVSDELDYAYSKHGKAAWGRHEFYAILLEEVEELWDVIKMDGPQSDLENEMVQIIAMVLRYAETVNRYHATVWAR